MKKTLSIIIPVYNEESSLVELLRRVSKAPVGKYQKEVIVVDDGSRDKTWEILLKNQKRLNLVLLRHERNLGKGRAVRTGLTKITGEVVIIQDADLEYDPRDYEKMLEVYLKSGVVVYGSRNLNPKRKGYFHFVWGVWLLSKICNLIYRTNLTDIYTCYKLFPSEILKGLNLTSEGFEIEAEVTGKILKNARKIEEVAISYMPRGFKEGKKIRIWDGVVGLAVLVRERLTRG